MDTPTKPATPSPAPAPTGKSASTLKRLRRREREALALDLGKPQVVVRLEAVTQALGEGKDPIRVLTHQGFALPDGTTAPPVSTSQAYVYLRRARLELQAYLARPRAELMADLMASLTQAERMAIKGGKASELLEVLDYKALQLGLPNRTTAARTLRLPTGDGPKVTAGGLSDEELAVIALKAREAQGG